METRLRNFSYDVKVAPVKVGVEAENGHERTDAKDISVVTSVVTEDTTEKVVRADLADESIKPYGIELTDKGEVEAPIKAEPDVVQERVEKAIKKNTKKSK